MVWTNAHPPHTHQHTPTPTHTHTHTHTYIYIIIFCGNQFIFDGMASNSDDYSIHRHLRKIVWSALIVYVFATGNRGCCMQWHYRSVLLWYVPISHDFSSSVAANELPETKKGSSSGSFLPPGGRNWQLIYQHKVRVHAIDPSMAHRYLWSHSTQFFFFCGRQWVARGQERVKFRFLAHLETGSWFTLTRSYVQLIQLCFIDIYDPISLDFPYSVAANELPEAYQGSSLGSLLPPGSRNWQLIYQHKDDNNKCAIGPSMVH